MIEDHSKDTLLYAGNAKLEISDWFFLKKDITIYSVELNDGKVNMTRTDSVWNYQFLIDYFSGPKKSNGGQAGGLELKDIHLHNISFNMLDGWIGQDLVASLKRADIIIENIDFKNKSFKVKDVYLEEPEFAQRDYDGKRPLQPNLRAIIDEIPGASALRWNNSGWTAAITQIRIFNGSFANDKETARAPYTDHFDGLHLKFGSISGSIDNFQFLRDTISAHVQLTTKERSGFEVTKLSSDLKFTPDIMEFSNLDLVTPKSHVRDYYAMKYKEFNEDMSSFIKAVELELHLKNSNVHSDDIAYFAPELKNWNRDFQVSGHAEGSIDNFSIEKLKLKSEHSILEGDLAMRGLPDIQTTFIEYKGENLQTNYYDLISIIPVLKEIKTPDLPKLGNIYYKGNFTGFLNDFVTYGTISTNLGVIAADINMKLPANAAPSYSGKLITQGFKLGAFLDEPKLGTVSLNGSVKGAGFNMRSLNADFDGHVNQIVYNNYNYHDIHIKGNFNRSLFTGDLSINDPNFQLTKLNGSLNLSGKELSFNSAADLKYIDLKALGFSAKPLKLAGRMNLNFTGNNIDNFLGSARIYDAWILNDSLRLSFDSLSLVSYIENDRKYLSLKTNELEAQLDGKFTILELPDAFKFFLSRYYPVYIGAPKKTLSPQDFNFTVRTNKISDYLSLFDKNIGGLDDATVSGRLNLEKSELLVNAKASEFVYAGRRFEGIQVNGDGNADSLNAEITADDIYLSDSFHFPATALRVSANNDVSNLHLTTRAGKTLNDAELNASVQTLSDGIKVHFFPSTFIVNDKKWSLEEDGELTLRNRYFDANKIRFNHANEQLIISTETDEITEKPVVLAEFKNINAEDFLPFVLTDPVLKGRLTGKGKVRDLFENPIMEFKGSADSFQMDDEYLGKVNLDATVDTKTGKIEFNTGANEEKFKFNFAGTYNYKDSTDETMDMKFLGDKVNLSILHPFLETVFSEINGMATSDLRIKGSSAHPFITGTAVIDSGSMTVDYTQCKYLFRNQVVKFDKDLIDFGRIKISDVKGNTGTVAGKLHHRFFKEFLFDDVRLETSKLLLLNTTRKNNNQFYGTVTGSALMTLNGPLTNLQMTIDGQPSVFDSSHIYLQTSDSKESTTVDYIDFIQFGSEITDSVKINQSTNIVVDMNLIANPSCKVDVILDAETNDVVHGQGTGRLNIRVGNQEPLSIRGKYDIEYGDYTFNFQTFLTKPFTLSSGSNITWNGDPYLAQIDIKAEYLAKNVDISVLNPGQANGIPQKEDVTIISHLTGSLKNPVINFEFNLGEKSGASRDYIIVKNLEKFKNDPNEMNKQVASLLLFNTFISTEQNFLTGGNTINVAASTVGGVVSGWLTGILNKALLQATEGIVSSYIDINPSLDLTQSANQLQANVRARLQVLLSKRLVVLLGGNLDYNNNIVISQIQRKGLLTPDLSVEWLLNTDGSIRVVGFYRTSIDATVGQRNRSGIQLTYRKDFNKLSDLFKSKKRIEEEENRLIKPKSETEE